jgi:ribosomal protein S12 methylthiotransferase accessory factor YcaO
MLFITEQGYKVKLLNLTTDSVPVVLAIIHSSENYPYFVSGAGAATNFQLAMTKAYNEAEFMLVSWRKIKAKQINPEQVVAPADHGKLFFQPKQKKHVKWLLESPEESLPDKAPLTDFLTKFDPILVDLSSKVERNGLHVIRALSDKLLPINFGYGNEHYGHQRPNVLGLDWKRKLPAFPHFFA